MKYREFGKLGLTVSEVGFGAWAIGGNKHGNSYGTTSDPTSLKAINKAIELGCNFFDTADVYGCGHSEELLAKALKNQRDKVIIASKVGGDFYSGSGKQNFTSEYIRFALNKTFERLQTDYLDVYQLHNPPLRLIEKAETYDVFDELKREGLIRAWGISIFDPNEGLSALQTAKPDSIQVVMNIFNARPLEKLLTAAKHLGCAIIAREPLANGFLGGKLNNKSVFEEGDIRHSWPPEYISGRLQAAESLKKTFPNLSLAQLALRFVLSFPQVSVTIPGIKTNEQAEENLAASNLPPLTKAELDKIAELAKNNFGLPSD